MKDYHDAEVKRTEPQDYWPGLTYYAVCVCGWRGYLQDSYTAAQDDKIAHDTAHNPERF